MKSKETFTQGWKPDNDDIQVNQVHLLFWERWNIDIYIFLNLKPFFVLTIMNYLLVSLSRGRINFLYEEWVKVKYERSRINLKNLFFGNVITPLVMLPGMAHRANQWLKTSIRIGTNMCDILKYTWKLFLAEI